MLVFQRTGLKFIEPAMGIPTLVNKRKILLCPESNRPNVMPIEKWLNLYEQLNVANYIVNFCVMNIDLPNAIRPKNTEELLVLIQNYDHIISHDGGVSHIAAMFNKHRTTLCSIPGLKNSWMPWTYNCQFIECNDLNDLNIKDIII